MSNRDIKSFINYIENFVICVKHPAKKYPAVPAIVAVEFDKEDWEHLKATGDWRALRKRDEQYLREAQAAEAN